MILKSFRFETVSGNHSSKDKYIEIDMDYFFNDGTIVAIAGDDFAVIAADTLMSGKDKLLQMSPVVVMSCIGYRSDTDAVIRLMRTAVTEYELTNLRPIGIDVMSQMLSNALYERRLFPHSVATILAGIDKEGKGAVFSFDCLGHCVRMNYHATGTAIAMVLPLLDSHLGIKNQGQEAPTKTIELTEAVSLVSNCMVVAAELGGGSGLMKIIKKDGIEVRELPLRHE